MRHFSPEGRRRSRTTVAPIFAIAAFVLPGPAASQALSPALQEVWDVEVACWEAITTNEVMPCYHEDFAGWGLGDTVPSNREQRRRESALEFETSEVVLIQLNPFDIVVHDDMAVIMYVASITRRDRATGEVTTALERWTDVMVNDGGTWAWISDHGIDITGAR